MHRDLWDKMDHQVQGEILEHLETQGRLVTQEHEVNQVTMVLLANLVRQEPKEALELQVYLGQRDPLVPRDPLARQDSREHPVQ